MFDLILVIIVVFVLFISSIIDFKTREIPDELSIGLIVIAVVLKVLYAFEIGDFSILVNSLIGFLIFLGISLAMYYTRQWGGGDAKLFMALGIALPYYPKELTIFNPNLNVHFMFIIILNLLIFGFLFGMIYMSYLLFKHKSKLNKFKLKIKKVYYILSIGVVILSLFFHYELKLLLLILAFLILIYPYLFAVIKFAEKEILTYKLKVDKLTEGDWILHDIYYKKRKIYSRKSPGVTKKQIEFFKKYKIKEVIVREGIPFVPAIFLGVLFSLIFGNIFPF
jgi:preflagellin peptidase FlaK